MTDVAAWYQTLSEEERFDRFGYRPWWEVLKTMEDRFRARDDSLPGFLIGSDGKGIEDLAWALDQQGRRLDLWYCIYTAEGWRLVFSSDTDAMTAKLLL